MLGLLFDMGVCTTKHWQTSGRLVQGLNVCTAEEISWPSGAWYRIVSYSLLTTLIRYEILEIQNILKQKSNKQTHTEFSGHNEQIIREQKYLKQKKLKTY